MSDTEEEPRDNNGAWPTGPVSSPIWVDKNSELPEETSGAVIETAFSKRQEYIQQMRNLSLRSRQQSDSYVLSRDDEDESTVNDVYVTAAASEQQGSPEKQTASSNALPPGTIWCPICMDFYSQILRSERLVLSTLCGHIFCSRCLPVAIEITRACPTCSRELTHREYHPIYI